MLARESDAGAEHAGELVVADGEARAQVGEVTHPREQQRVGAVDAVAREQAVALVLGHRRGGAQAEALAEQAAEARELVDAAEDAAQAVPQLLALGAGDGAQQVREVGQGPARAVQLVEGNSPATAIGARGLSSLRA
ncbi:hypothetical protein [Nannocystis pusilla]|uniref:hypothetical protein n=1 Tax=Nannocystis pusilla TaxID=889268 RepID=UPI003B7EA32B